MNKQELVEGLKKFVGMDNTPETREAIMREVYIIDASKKQFRDEEVLALAKAMNGPQRELPVGAKFTMQELREAKWDMLSSGDRKVLLNQAITVLNYMVANYTVLEKDGGSRKETEDNV